MTKGLTFMSSDTRRAGRGRDEKVFQEIMAALQ